MDFLKKHYEKIILVVVLLGVVGFLVFLPILIAADQEDLRQARDRVVPTKISPLPPLDMARQQTVLERLSSPANFDFSTRNKLFNPIEWKRRADGTMFPIINGNEIGVRAVVVTKITPLYLVVTLDSVDTNTASPRYVIGLEHQAAATLSLRHKQTRYAAVGEKKDLFTLVSVKGDPVNPDEVVLKLADSVDPVTVPKGKPYQRVDAYTADLKYDPEKKTFPGCRIGSPLLFNAENYIIVAIDADKVILSSQSNEKRTTLPFTP